MTPPNPLTTPSTSVPPVADAVTAPTGAAVPAPTSGGHPATAVRTAPAGPTVGLALQVGLLAVLSLTAGLGPAGWLTGAVFGLVTRELLMRGMHRHGLPALGAANRVTLTRTVLVGGVAALAVESLGRPVPVGLLVALTGTALLLDGVDGQVARRTGTVSELGARFDMEVDAFLILVLSVYLVGVVGPWVLAIGAMRYVFVVAGRLAPWLTAPLPPRFSRKVVAAWQGIALVVASTGVLPRPLTAGTAGLALAALCWSFGRDVGWLWNARTRRESRVGRADRASRADRAGTSGARSVRPVAGSLPPAPYGGRAVRPALTVRR